MISQVGQRAIPRLDLGVAFMEYQQNQQDFIGTTVFPVFNSMFKAAYFPAITREGLMRRAKTKRAAESRYNRDNFQTKDIEFICEEHGLEGLIDDSKRAMYKVSFDPELIMTQTLGRRLMIEQELRIKQALINTSTFTGSKLFVDNSANPWTTVSTDVRSQITAAKEKVRVNCGVQPNCMIITQSNLDALKVNTQILEAIKYTARPTDAEIQNALADFFGVQQVLIAKAVYNGANEGQVFSGSYIWDDSYAFFGVISDDEPGTIVSPGIGRTVLWTSDSPDNVHVEMYREEQSRGDVVRVRQHTDELVIDPYFGFLMKVR